MLNRFIRHGKGAIAALSVLLAACGGGGGGGDGTVPPPAGTPQTVSSALSSAALVPANDTATNTSASFTVLQSAGVPAVVVNSPPKVNFAVFSDGKLVQGLTNTNVRFALAKLVPGTNGDPDQWVSYVYRTETPTATVGPNGAAVLTTAKQATTDPQPAATAATMLQFNPDGYYTYTFSTDVKDPAKTNGVTFEPGRTHRVAIQLSYTNAAGETVRVNPYFDFTIDANGNSVPVTDASLTRKMADVSSCNGCHEKLALHGGGRVDVQFCVMCHNPGTTDANSGQVLTMSTMVHKVHAGRLLARAPGGEVYTIWGNANSKHDFSEVGFPQDLRNCTKCHSGSNPATPQGDNWKTRVSKDACLACHASGTGSVWDTTHKGFAASIVVATANAKDMTNQQCVDCHKVGSNIAPERVHWNQNEENAAKYKMNIEDAAFDASTNKLTVKYFLSDPTNGNAAYNLVTPDCTAAAPNVCSTSAKFGNLRLIVGYGNLASQPAGVTEITSGNAAQFNAYLGTNDGSNHYTASISLPTPSATNVVTGTARISTVGQIKEPKLQVKSNVDPRPEVTPRVLTNVVVQHTFKEVALTGTLLARRTIVSNDKCNVCHGALGTTSGSNTLAEAFHSGARNTVEACVICHDPNRMSSTKMTNGLDFNENYSFKRMIHGIHGNSKRTFPFTHGNKVVDAFNKDGTSATGLAPLAADVENYAAEVAWPGVGINCNACHVDNSYKVDRGTVGSVIKKDTGVTDPMQWKVISPQAASCTACHDSPKAMGHVTSFGNASFGDRTQAQSIGTQETCADCHSSGGFKGVDIVHGQN